MSDIVTLFLQHLQGALILRLLKLYKVLKPSKLHKTVDRCVIKSVLLIKCGDGCICSSKVCNEYEVCNCSYYNNVTSSFGGLEVVCWPLIPKFAGSNTAEAVGFFGRKNPQHAFLRRGSALWHVKEPKSDVEVNFGKISRPFLAHSSNFRCWVR
jgi:hypothetical protein